MARDREQPDMEAEATTNPTFEAEPWVQTLDIEAAVRDEAIALCRRFPIYPTL